MSAKSLPQERLPMALPQPSVYRPKRSGAMARLLGESVGIHSRVISLRDSDGTFNGLRGWPMTR